MAKYKKFRDELDPNAPIWSIRINQCLLDNNITQAELAQMSDLSPGTISSWISGNRYGVFAEPRANGLKRVANVLNVSTDYLLGNVNVKSKDLDVSTICKKTGLTEKSVNYLLGLRSDDITEIIDAMVENEDTENRFLGLVDYIMETSEALIEQGYPIVNSEDLKLYKRGTKEYADLFDERTIYNYNHMSIEFHIFKMQTNFTEMIKKMTKFNEIKTSEEPK